MFPSTRRAPQRDGFSPPQVCEAYYRSVAQCLSAGPGYASPAPHSQAYLCSQLSALVISSRSPKFLPSRCSFYPSWRWITRQLPPSICSYGARSLPIALALGVYARLLHCRRHDSHYWTFSEACHKHQPSCKDSSESKSAGTGDRSLCESRPR